MVLSVQNTAAPIHQGKVHFYDDACNKTGKCGVGSGPSSIASIGVKGEEKADKKADAGEKKGFFASVGNGIKTVWNKFVDCLKFIFCCGCYKKKEAEEEKAEGADSKEKKVSTKEELQKLAKYANAGKKEKFDNAMEGASDKTKAEIEKMGEKWDLRIFAEQHRHHVDTKNKEKRDTAMLLGDVRAVIRMKKEDKEPSKEALRRVIGDKKDEAGVRYRKMSLAELKAVEKELAAKVEKKDDKEKEKTKEDKFDKAFTQIAAALEHLLRKGEEPLRRRKGEEESNLNL